MPETLSASGHQPRLMQALAQLLREQRVAALATLEADGTPVVSMVPFALEPALGCLVLHVSALAQHTGNMEREPRVSLLVMRPEQAGEPVHALPRVSLFGRASTPQRDSQDWWACRAAYLERFPEAEPMTQLGDFRFVAIELEGARQIAGFGAARSVGVEELVAVLRAACRPVGSGA
jgi:putative heme iron utilization protein